MEKIIESGYIKLVLDTDDIDYLQVYCKENFKRIRVHSNNEYVFKFNKTSVSAIDGAIGLFNFLEQWHNNGNDSYLRNFERAFFK